MPKLNLPSSLAVILSLVAGVLEVLNQVTFGFPAPWHTFTTYGLLVLAMVGISPLVGTAFRQALTNAFHVSGVLFTVLSIVTMAIAAAVTTFSIDSTWKGILLGIVAVLGGLGFGPNATALAPGAAR